MKKAGFLLTMCLLLICGVSMAQTDEFVHKAAVAGMKEVKAGELAKQKAVNPRVRAFGERMITDHTMANEKLMAIAKKKGWASQLPAPGSIPGDPMLINSKGAEFDRMYVTMMVKDHREAVALFEDEAKNGKDAELREFAKMTLPKLKDHLASIEAIAKEMKIKG